VGLDLVVVGVFIDPQSELTMRSANATIKPLPELGCVTSASMA
jgi:hypothetical protein